VQELATWRGRLIRISSREEAGRAHVVVGDTASGAVVFRGAAETPTVVWAPPWDFPARAGSEPGAAAATGAGVTRAGQPGPAGGADLRARGSSSPPAARATAAARAAWSSNRAAFEAGVSRRFSGQFRCAAIAAGAPAEVLELGTDGRFVWMSGGGEGGSGGEAERLQLEGQYRAVPGSDPAVLLFRVGPAATADGGGPAGEDGVCLRARLLAAGGRPAAVEWVSGHGGLGPGAASRPLAANTATGGGGL
jgi:hypothetical protein